MKENVIRKNSYGIAGAVWGDEGKGKIIDYLVDKYAKDFKVVNVRNNGGANAGHNICFGDVHVALHQLPSGVFTENTTAVLGRSMVINPQGLIYEIDQVKKYSNNEIKSSIKINSRASLALRTHQALEYVLKDIGNFGKGATGQGIGPAYADQTYRRELSIKDLLEEKYDKFAAHYDLYQQMVDGMGFNLSEIPVPIASDTKGQRANVGSKKEFIDDLKQARERLLPHIQDVYGFIKESWNQPEKFAYVFESAQAIGLHREYGVHPDVTASDTTFLGINTTTEGLVQYQNVEHRQIITKGPYITSVGSRKVPTLMPEKEAERIRIDYNEVGATTGRKRDVAYPDMPSLEYYSVAGYANEIGITHMDATYEDSPIKVCTKYLINDKKVDYRPYQDYLDQVTPFYEEFPTWSSQRISLAKNYGEIPTEAKNFLEEIYKRTGLPVTIIGTGPKREDIVEIDNKK